MINSPDESGQFGSTSLIADRDCGGPIRRILILKLDHIGDLIIAAPALILLRQSFADAHITLLCGPWNVGLSKRLGVADEIHPFTIFDQDSSKDNDNVARERRRAAIVAAMLALDLAPFDLVIDLRRDEDTRELLKLFDGRNRVGFGDRDTFSYLDIALPVTHRFYDTGTTALRLDPGLLDGGMGHRIDARGLHLTTRMGEIDLDVRTDSVWAPSDDGVTDTRKLGVALTEIHVRRAIGRERGGAIRWGPPSALAREQMYFGPGWLAWESWGRWSSLEDATVTLRFPTDVPETAILANVSGHTSDSHPIARVGLQAGDVLVEQTFRPVDQPSTITLETRARIGAPAACSEPVLMRAGRYRGLLEVHVGAVRDWRPLAIRVRGAKLGRVLANATTPAAVRRAGLQHFPFEVELLDSAEPILIEIEPLRREDPVAAIAIRAVTLECQQARSPQLPVAHMEQQLLDLAVMAAVRFAPNLVFRRDEIVKRLTEAQEGSSAKPAIAQLALLGGKRRSPFRRPPNGRHIIGIGVGANKETKRWSRSNFISLCRKLLRLPEVCLVFVGGPGDREEVAEIIAALGRTGVGRIVDLCATCRIEDLGELLAQLDGYIGLDTGTTHFAGRIGLPTFAIFGAAHDPHEWGPVGADAGWLATDVACGGCSAAELWQCGHGLECMVSLTPEKVWPALEARLFADSDVAKRKRVNE